jgi:serine/threonine protein kinase
LGTLARIAPEQAKGARDVEAAADIWALGVILYCMLTGRPPHVASRGRMGVMIGLVVIVLAGVGGSGIASKAGWIGVLKPLTEPLKPEPP